MTARSTHSGLTLVGRIERKTHDVEMLRNLHSDWDTMNDTEKLNATRSVSPETSDTVFNVTTDRLHEYFVDNLNFEDTTPKANLSASWIGLGDDSGSGTATTDTDLNNRTFQTTVTDASDNGKELFTSTFVDSSQGNGQTYDEIGLFSGDPGNLGDSDVFLMNHATFPDVTKDNSKTVTFDVTLTFSDV